MDSQLKYKQFITEFVHQQIVLFGPNLAKDTVRRVVGLEIDAKGHVIEIKGDVFLVLENLISEFLKLSPQITNHIAAIHLEKDQELKTKLSSLLNPINLQSALIKIKK